MDFEIIKLPKGKSAVLGKIVQDDLVSRQTIAVRDTDSLGMKGEFTIILIEGSEPALRRVLEIVGEEGTILKGQEKEETYKKIKDDEDNVAEGLGLMFG
ncbi:MAG: hypothetical protein JXA22_08340 [Candidatus Thermoplasmatota archaeon]|nr:hypothetical protein [Candidatus Thermoplasmatota archaeon]